ncbi:M1 family aminopeptidase [Pseudofulvibacter geojedonensis]|uniref:M1 family aminopeptidase n=1 Tax=Pseudofulvibacter geojedonensis TaxID=1123758 RepID=A0ABW3HYW0_9FLAO
MKAIKISIFFIFLSCYSFLQAQEDIFINAEFNPDENQVSVKQKILIHNTTNKPIDRIYLSDWNNSSSSKNSPLAIRYEEEYIQKMHFAKDKERGITTINSILSNNISLKYKRVEVDIIEVALENPLDKKQSIELILNYQLQLPSSKFNGFGIDNKQDIALKEWFIVPAKLNKNWEYYSNKDLDDLYFPNSNLYINLTFPKSYKITSDLDIQNITSNDSISKVLLKGVNRINTELYLSKNSNFSELKTENLSYISDIDNEGIGIGLKAVIHDKIDQFLIEKLGKYPHKKLILSELAYKNNPVYGLNQLPDFIRPYPDGFQYEVKILKTTIHNFLKNTVNTNPRKDFWLNDALETYLMYQYIEKYYPDMKILGTLSKIWGLRSFEIAKKKFNDQYDYTTQYMARINLGQAINTSKDSLLKFNQKIANKNKAGIGLVYLNDYLGKDIIPKTIKEFYLKNKTANIVSNDFFNAIQSKTDKDISWFISDFINTNNPIDYTILDAVEGAQTIQVQLKNRAQTTTPIAIYQIVDKKIVHKQYIDGFVGEKTVLIPNHQPDRLVLNYEEIVPEINQRNNTKTIKNHLFNKPLKFSFLKDAEAPKHNQAFYTPQLGFNLYDGLTPGMRFSNKAILKKPFTYSIKPTYGLRSKTLIGSASAIYTQFIKNKNLFSVDYALSYSTYHYQEGLRYQRFNPFIVFSFRNKNDLRDNFSQKIVARHVTVQQEQQSGIETDPNYSVFNLKYGLSNKNLLHFYSAGTDIQFAKRFGKISASFEWRRTFENNRQINARLFAGSFLYNNTNSDYFSFALDRPTDYLFDYDYLGRSESTGIYSQQIIIAEGGFKSKLLTPFANSWITTTNLNTNIWKYIFAYGDIGFVGNRNSTNFVYDSGIHLNLVPDYFELYFPVYSNLGWEVNQTKYQEKIRFKIVLTPKVLIGLFTRKWH